MSEIVRIPTENMSREEWLQHRRSSLGGSDAAAILGLSQWVTPYTVWADKTGRLPEQPDNEAMRQGRDFEDYVAQRFTEATGKKVRRNNAILKNTDYPFAHANIDRSIVGENAGLECKTTSVMNLWKFKNGEYPDTYYCQCVHYMAVTGADRWYLAVLVFGQDFYWFCIERDEAEIEALMAAEKEFWQFIDADTPPPVDGFKPTTDAINMIYAESITASTPVELFGRENMLKRYIALKDEIKVLETEKEAIEQTIKEDLQKNEYGACSSFEIKWKSQTRNTLDPKALLEDMPELDLSPYYKTSTFRRFSIKERME